MSSKDKNVVSSSSSGIGFVGLLTIVFIALKLIGVIEWSWLWVLAPLWISTCLVLAILLVAFIFLYIGIGTKRK